MVQNCRNLLAWNVSMHVFSYCYMDSWTKIISCRVHLLLRIFCGFLMWIFCGFLNQEILVHDTTACVDVTNCADAIELSRRGTTLLDVLKQSCFRNRIVEHCSNTRIHPRNPPTWSLDSINPFDANVQRETKSMFQTTYRFYLTRFRVDLWIMMGFLPNQDARQPTSYSLGTTSQGRVRVFSDTSSQPGISCKTNRATSHDELKLNHLNHSLCAMCSHRGTLVPGFFRSMLVPSAFSLFHCDLHAHRETWCWRGRLQALRGCMYSNRVCS